jgi:NAD(P)-dependent dehydrogenase (short-subunit alcohol dehydrogenase family)
MTQNLFSVADRVVIVTGASRGIGRAIAEGFLEAGARVVLVGRSESVEEQARGYGPAEAVGIRADVSAREDRQRICEQAVEQLGRIDVLVNNAGITRTGEGDYSEEDWDETLDVNLKAAFFLAQSVAGVMRERQGGSIINIGSISAHVAMPDNPAYQAAKGGLLQLTRAMALDWAASNIRVNQVNPGYIHTDMSAASYADPEKHRQRAGQTMLGRWGTPQDLVGACLFLASDASSYITGIDMNVDGGWVAKGM